MSHNQNGLQIAIYLNFQTSLNQVPGYPTPDSLEMHAYGKQDYVAACTFRNTFKVKCPVLALKASLVFPDEPMKFAMNLAK